ncbi:MAG: MmcQ/YjbR family DNA-binding protein [Akkermansiaceae bacterium]
MMSYLADDARSAMLAKNAVTEETPFGPDVLVYKVGGKMFATLGFEDEIGNMNLKCDPDRAVELREEHTAIIPGYHMNKKHWNTLILDGSLFASLVAELIDHSYDLVISGMTKKQRAALESDAS